MVKFELSSPKKKSSLLSFYHLFLPCLRFFYWQSRCDFEDILLEMDRILRPEGTVIFRDGVEELNAVSKISRGMRWNTKMMDHEEGPLVPEKILVAVKIYWVAAANSTATEE